MPETPPKRPRGRPKGGAPSRTGRRRDGTFIPTGEGVMVSVRLSRAEVAVLDAEGSRSDVIRAALAAMLPSWPRPE